MFSFVRRGSALFFLVAILLEGVVLSAQESRVVLTRGASTIVLEPTDPTFCV
jgi:hypothetical protein